MGTIWKHKAEWEGFQSRRSRRHKSSGAEKHTGYSRGHRSPARSTKAFTSFYAAVLLIKPKGRARGPGQEDRPGQLLLVSRSRPPTWGPIAPPKADLRGGLSAPHSPQNLGDPGSVAWPLEAGRLGRSLFNSLLGCEVGGSDPTSFQTSFICHQGLRY